jgi:hypothetical protein
MHKFEKSEMKRTAKRPKQPFDPALDAPVVLTLDQLEKVAAGSGMTSSSTIGHTTTGVVEASARALVTSKP